VKVEVMRARGTGRLALRAVRLNGTLFSAATAADLSPPMITWARRIARL